MALNIPSLVVSAVTTFDGKALAKGQKQISSFDKSVKSVAKSLGLAFSATAVVAFGKASVKAFAEDEKAAARLSRTVTNLGLSFENTRITKFIADLEKTANVADDVLRPAFSSLLTTTGSVEKSQKLLALALDVSAGSGEDVATVAKDLSLAYLGNNKGLTKYRLGLTKAELAGKSFSEIQDLINKQFAGQNAARLDTYEGKIAAVGVAFGNLQETVGEGLVDAFAAIGGGTEASDAALAIESIATAIAKVTTAAGQTIGTIPTLLANLKKLGKDIFLGFAGAQAGVKLTPTPTIKPPTKTPTDISKVEQAKRLAKLEADAAKRAKLLAALQTKSIKAEQDKAKLAKAARLLELKQINIAAALKGKITEEEKTRLLLMQAILDEDADKAETLEKKLEEIQKKNAKIAADLLAIGQTKDPFATWAGSLSLALLALGKLGKGIADVPGLVPGVNYNPGQNADRNYDLKVAAVEAAVAEITGNGDPGTGSQTIFAEDDTIDDILTKVENTAAEAAAAAESAAASVTETQVVVDALAAAVTNGSPIAGVNFNPSQNRDRNYDSGFATQAPTIIVNNTGSVIMENEFVDAVNKAVVIANGQGLKAIRPGALPEFE
jgi:hypothetical protein